MKGVAVLHDSEFLPKGVIRFHQQRNRLVVHVRASGLTKGLHGFHVHESGDLTRGCDSLCAHYNPDNTRHGSIRSTVRHRGDLGNVKANRKGEVTQTLSTSKLTLKEILGRSIIIHANQDDLGKGENDESLKTGNAGKRVLCGVIGYAS